MRPNSAKPRATQEPLPGSNPQKVCPSIGPFIKLDAKLLDACIGEYVIAPDSVFLADGAKVTIRREGDHLVWQGFGRNALPGALDVYPESETNFFVKINGAQLTFIKNDKGEVTALIHHMAGLPDSEGKKLKNE